MHADEKVGGLSALSSSSHITHSFILKAPIQMFSFDAIQKNDFSVFWLCDLAFSVNRLVLL